MNIQEIRQKYPQYDDMSDQQLADSYHGKYYSDIPKEDFYSRIGLNSQSSDQEKAGEGFLSTLPRNIIAGLAGLGHTTLNLPYETAKGIESNSEPIKNIFNKKLPINKYLGDKTGHLENLANKLNKENNVPEEMINKNWEKPFTSEDIPHQQEYDFAKMLGQKDSGSLFDNLIQKGITYAPEIAAGYGLVKNIGKQILPKVTGKVTGFSEYGGLKRKIDELKNKSNLSKESAEESQLASENAMKEANELQSAPEISSYLNSGAAHNVRGAKSLEHRLNNIESYWKDSYKNLKSNLKTSNFQMEDLPKYKQDLNHAIANIKDLEIINGKLVIRSKPEVSHELQSIIDKAPTSKDIKADDFLTKYQDFRDARYDLLQRAKDASTSIERKALFQAYEDSKPIEQTVKNALNDGLGKHRGEFERINNGYSTQIYPLRNNKVAKQALKGKLGPNAIEDLAGNGEGQELMREIVKQDPELLRNIIGQRYSANASKIHHLDENTAEYLSEMPELQRIMKENLQAVKSKLEEVNKHKELRKISLKEKMNAENEAKELNKKLDLIKKDFRALGKLGMWGVAGSTGLGGMYKAIR
jgi:hypothetical protein